MLRLTVLGSGSKGNAMVLAGDDGAVLVDAGFGPRSLARRLAAASCDPTQIVALVLTHEHADHSHGVVAAAQKWNWPVYASRGTIAAMRQISRRARFRHVKWHPLDAEGAALGNLHVRGYNVSHDAAEPLAIVLEENRSGARVGVAVDLGTAPPALSSAFAYLDLLMVESNHDRTMLRQGPYPAVLKRRIASRTGHLSNDAAAQFAASCSHAGLRQVVLAHLSETNNDPAVAVTTVSNALRARGWKGTVVPTAQRTQCGPLSVAACGAHQRSPVQLSFVL